MKKLREERLEHLRKNLAALGKIVVKEREDFKETTKDKKKRALKKLMKEKKSIRLSFLFWKFIFQKMKLCKNNYQKMRKIQREIP